MKKLLTLSFVAIAILISTKANAQSATSSAYSFNDWGGEGSLSIGTKAGINSSVIRIDGEGEDLDALIGFNAGLFIEYTTPSNLYFLTGLDLFSKGGKEEETYDGYTYKLKCNPLYLQLPAHIGYKIDLIDDVNIGMHAGPYLAYGIGGKVAVEESWSDSSEKEEEDFFGSEEDGGLKSIDVGLGFGVDLNINRFKIGLGYDFGATNIGREDEIKIKNQTFYMHVGYRF